MHKLALILVSSLLLSGCTLKNLFLKKPAGLDIQSDSPATIYLGEDNLGSTPYASKNITPGSHVLRLIPQDTTLSPYETTIDLKPEVQVVINRHFGESAVESSGYTLSLIPDIKNKALLSVVSDPDISNLTIDGVATGFTPISKYETTPGSHEVIISTPGYLEQKLSVNPALGYNLLVNVKLSQAIITLTPPSPPDSETNISTTSATLSPSPTSSLPKPYVTVSDLPEVRVSGGLNVRSSASSSSDPLGKAKINEQLKYLGVTTDTGWHKIEFEGQLGYVSAKYSTLSK